MPNGMLYHRDCITHLPDEVEAQVKPLEVDQGFEALDFGNDIVVQLQLLQTLHAQEVVNFENVY